MVLPSGASHAESGPFRHAATIYGSDEGFLATVVPFVQEGIDAGESTILALTANQQALLTAAIGQPPGVSVLTPGDHYGRPLSALQANKILFDGYLRGGAERVRLVGDLPRDDPAIWKGWARYEALCNHNFVDLNVSALCTYDTRNTTEEVLGDVRRLHSLIAAADGRHSANSEYVQPLGFLSGWSQTVADPLEAGEPEVALVNPTPFEGRQAVTLIANSAGVDTEGLVIAVSEVLNNAYIHGQPPVRFSAWSRQGRVVVTVTDAGPGPSDPFAGLCPPSRELLGGRGLWIANQTCDSLSISPDERGCVVRMISEASPKSLSNRR